MGINPTPTNHRSFTYDGKSTREFGVYITGKDVFNAPERAVEMISIPGRDGEYALDQGHFNNIEVTYRAGIVADSTTDFAEAISNFRNWLASRKGYCRLTDEYNTEEYRMAVFKNAIALEHEGLLTGEFDVTFDCKPQRYLAIGEELTEIGAWGNTETAEGEVVTIDASSDTAVKALTADIDPIQDLSHGDPSPDNICPISGHDEVGVSVNGVNQWDEEYKQGYYNSSGTFVSANNQLCTKNMIPVVSSTTYYLHIPVAEALNVALFEFNASGTLLRRTTPFTPSNRLFTTTENCKFILLNFHSEYGATYNNDISINYPSTDHDYHEYVGTTHTTTLPSTTYGGTLDVVSGELTVDRATVNLGTMSWNYYSAGSTSDKAIFYSPLAGAVGKPNSNVANCMAEKYKTDSVNGVLSNVGGIGISNNSNPPNVWVSTPSQSDTPSGQLCYELATPTTTQLTPQQIELLLGENNIFANSGNVTVEYGHNPIMLTNPTWFPSKPLLAVEGYGEVKFNNRSIVNIENATIGKVIVFDGFSRSVAEMPYTSSLALTLDTSALETGDEIVVDGVRETITFTYPTNIVSMTTTTATGMTETHSYSGKVATFNTNIDAETIEYGTSKTWSAHLVANIVSNSGGTTSTPSTFLDFSYDGAQTITVTFRQRSSDSSSSFSVPSLSGTSTRSIITDTIHIDCDIGEAYMVEDGVPVSLNQHIDLGSDLPTLPSGDTEVTYDNTITKVEVKPNWWKV